VTAHVPVVDAGLRLSALRALLGAITEGVRLVKVRREADLITFTAILSSSHHADAQEELSCAVTQIVADYPECQFSEEYLVSDDPLPRENLFSAGWVFQRYEPSRTD
jgi:hypothetical protein